jgi:hypothetical protein
MVRSPYLLAAETVSNKAAKGKTHSLFFGQEAQVFFPKSQHGQETSMRALMGVAAVALTAVAIGIWLNSISNSGTEISSVPKPAASAAISFWEIHNQAHVDSLPIQQIDDQSVVFTEARR